MEIDRTHSAFNINRRHYANETGGWKRRYASLDEFYNVKRDSARRAIITKLSHQPRRMFQAVAVFCQRMTEV